MEYEFDDDAPVLEVEDLVIEYRTSDGPLRAADGLTFTIEEGEAMGLVGESGCGKSTVAKSILRLLPRNGAITSGSIRFRGVDLSALSESEINDVRWKHISMVSQSAMESLNPVHRISSQIVEALRAHDSMSKSEARDRTAELFEIVGLDPARMDEYPHQFSGGMKQRAYIAMALAHNPSLIIADEPTTALDVVVQRQILAKLKDLQEEFDIAVLLITHDISVVAETCSKMGVMYGGKMMEYGDLESIFDAPYNPYTLGLQNAFPTLKGEKQDLIEIPGSPPDLVDPQSGCRFQNRCPFQTDECLTEHPPLEAVDGEHYSACYRHEAVDMLREQSRKRETWEGLRGELR